MANEIYSVSWWGSPVKDDWGGIYYDLSDPLISEYVARVVADGGIVEAKECINFEY